MKNLLLPGSNGHEVRWIHYAELSSTQLGCRDLAAEYPAPLILTAGRQAAGRGRFDRRWESPLGNFYGSLLWPAGGAPQLALLELAVQTVGYLQELGVEARLKWPNDIIVNECKLAGLIGELFYYQEQPLLILGLGLNVNIEPEGPVRYGATSLKRLLGHDLPIIEFRKNFCPYLAGHMPLEIDAASLKSRYAALCDTLGHTISLDLGHKKVVHGQAVALDEDFGLIIEDEFGKRQAYSSGDVNHLIISR